MTLNSFKKNDKDQYVFVTTAEEGAQQTVKTSNLPKAVEEVVSCLSSAVSEMYADIQEVHLMGASVKFDKDGNGLASFETYMRVGGEWLKAAILNPFPFKETEVYKAVGQNETKDAAYNRIRIEGRNQFYFLFLRLQEVVVENWLELFDAPQEKALSLFDDAEFLKDIQATSVRRLNLQKEVDDIAIDRALSNTEIKGRLDSAFA